MHEMQTIVTQLTDVRGVCLSVGLSVMAYQLARAHCARVIRCSLCQITLAYCFTDYSVAQCSKVTLAASK